MKNTTKTATTPKVSQTEAKATESIKTAFDTLLETQTKLVNGFVESSKQFADSFKATETIEKSREMLNEWLEKQQVKIEDSVEGLKKQVKFESAPVLVKESVEAQQELGKEWFSALVLTLKSKDSKELQEILTANVQKLQDNVKEVSNYWVENFGKPVNMNEVFTTDYAVDITKKLVDMWKPAKI
jgi:predicted adenine nucleotide alpha hydrolase (AANH) superfamily ATPase